ncbi:hypothetical protein ABIB25_001629 [Nakamurella sp. UYEF19]|uniref:MmyB family transcriptional regulator n=1 Tax=Nakamurella sp. UYEF19 TaxID=1756392 RepID=UPI0033932D13
MRFLFLDPMARARIVNWSVFAQAAVASLRMEAGRRPNDRHLLDLIDELRLADQDVARWWDDRAVRDYASVAKRIRHPAAGDLFVQTFVGVQRNIVRLRCRAGWLRCNRRRTWR